MSNGKSLRNDYCTSPESFKRFGEGCVYRVTSTMEPPFDIIDIINDLEDDSELKNAFQQRLSTDENPAKIEEPKTDSNVVENLSKRQKIIKTFFPNHNIESKACVLL